MTKLIIGVKTDPITYELLKYVYRNDKSVHFYTSGSFDIGIMPEKYILCRVNTYDDCYSVIKLNGIIVSVNEFYVYNDCDEESVRNKLDHVNKSLKVSNLSEDRKIYDNTKKIVPDYTINYKDKIDLNTRFNNVLNKYVFKICQ